MATLALRNWSVSKKFALLSVLGLAAVLVVGLVSLSGVGQIGAASDLGTRLAAVNQNLATLDMKESDVQIAQRDMLLAVDDKQRARANAELDAIKTVAAQTWTQITALPLGPQDASALEQLHGDYSDYLDQVTAQMPILAPIDPSSAAAGVALERERLRADAVQARINAIRAALKEEQDAGQRQLHATSSTVRVTVLLGTLVAMILLAGVATVTARSITRPLRRMVQALKAVANRDLTVLIDVESRDEVGQMADALREALAGIREAIAALADSSTALASASEELSAVSTQLGHAAEETSSQTGSASASAHEVAGSVATMSAATEQLSASIGQIADQASTAAGVAAQAVATADETSTAVARLTQASAEIDEIVRTITVIAEQTNLLALNATIEAARAGDAGKGFAVVASEVKDLAQETSRATDDITAKIAGIQALTGTASEAITRIGAVIGQISENQTTIAAAVEEQTAVTAEISRSVVRVAGGSGQMAETITMISATAASTAEGAAATQQSAGELAQLAGRVQSLATRFTY